MKIGNVELDFTSYDGQDSYSDGFIEEEILNFVKNNTQNKDFLYNDYRWPILYHFSLNRRNLLEWYDFSSKATLLEVGAGCGALTGLFSEKNRNVVAVELSKRRAEIIAYRHQHISNLKIIVGNLRNINLKDTFDYVTLIGVLEYASLFMEGENCPYKQLLSIISSYLKQEGKLIIAIENKFGLKYWNGSAEDHTGIIFEGIENYPHNTISTFSKNEVKSLLFETGYHNLAFYYPYPDYKLPDHVFSDYCLPKIGQIFQNAPNYDQDKVVLFNEGLVFDNLIRNDMFDHFANSFLIFAAKR